jgi:hypothetical protein
MEFLPALELIDRLCISRIKYNRTQGQNQIELDWYEDQWKKIQCSPEIEQIITDLTQIHNNIWDLESELKSGVEQHLSLEEIGRRAIKIRNENSKRIALKNKAATLLNHPVREIKMNHLSDS